MLELLGSGVWGCLHEEGPLVVRYGWFGSMDIICKQLAIMMYAPAIYIGIKTGSMFVYIQLTKYSKDSGMLDPKNQSEDER